MLQVSGCTIILRMEQKTVNCERKIKRNLVAVIENFEDPMGKKNKGAVCYLVWYVNKADSCRICVSVYLPVSPSYRGRLALSCP